MLPCSSGSACDPFGGSPSEGPLSTWPPCVPKECKQPTGRILNHTECSTLLVGTGTGKAVEKFLMTCGEGVVFADLSAARCHVPTFIVGFLLLRLSGIS